MIQSRILEYAKKHIEVTAQENGIMSVNISKYNDGVIFLEMSSGKTYELSQGEIEYQAKEYLESELQDLINY